MFSSVWATPDNAKAAEGGDGGVFEITSRPSGHCPSFVYPSAKFNTYRTYVLTLTYTTNWKPEMSNELDVRPHKPINTHRSNI